MRSLLVALPFFLECICTLVECDALLKFFNVEGGKTIPWLYHKMKRCKNDFWIRNLSNKPGCGTLLAFCSVMWAWESCYCLFKIFHLLPYLFCCIFFFFFFSSVFVFRSLSASWRRLEFLIMQPFSCSHLSNNSPPLAFSLLPLLNLIQLQPCDWLQHLLASPLQWVHTQLF